MPLTFLLSFGVENQQPADDSKIEFKIKVKGVGQECPTPTKAVSNPHTITLRRSVRE